MPTGVNSDQQIGHVALEGSFAVAAAPTNANAFRVTSLVTNPEQDQIQRPDKNPSPGQTIGIGGNYRGAWSTRMALAGVAAAGGAPDIGPILQAALGAAPVVSAGVSVTYPLGVQNNSLSIWNFWTPSDATQYLSLGSVVNSMSIDASGTQPMIEFAGPAYWVLDTDQFADAATEAKGGLASFPAPPAAPVTNGSMLSLFAGSATFDGNLLTEIRSFRMNVDFAREIPQDVIFSGQYGAAPAAGKRTITFDLNIYDKAGDANFSDLKNKAVKKIPIDVTIVIGIGSGSMVQIPFKNVQLGVPQTDDGSRRKAINFAGSQAHMTSTIAQDEFSLIYL